MTNPHGSTSDNSVLAPKLAVSETALRLLTLMIRLVQGQELGVAKALETGLASSSSQFIKDMHALRALGLPVNRPYSLAHQGYCLAHALQPLEWSADALRVWQLGLGINVPSGTGDMSPQHTSSLPQAVQTARLVVIQRLNWATVDDQQRYFDTNLTTGKVHQALGHADLSSTPSAHPMALASSSSSQSSDDRGAEGSPTPQEWQQWCQQGQQVQLMIACPLTGQPQPCLLEPHRLVSEPAGVATGGNSTLLLGYDVDRQDSRLVPLHTIVQAEQLPTCNRHAITLHRVVFRLMGRLAHTYRAYSGEQVAFVPAEEGLLVTAWVGHVPGLLNRLMRYGANCQVVSPQSARLLMRERIAQQLALL
jgi:WYL domain